MSCLKSCSPHPPSPHPNLYKGGGGNYSFWDYVQKQPPELLYKKS